MTRTTKKAETTTATQNNGIRTRVLFVCMGNICRSPMAKGVFESMVKQAGLSNVVEVASAGTHAFHAGEAADARAVNTAGRRGYDLAGHQARLITADDFNDYDYILAMDWDNLALLQRQAPRSQHHKLQLLMRFASEYEAATVSDPYHGSQQGFETALDYIEDACTGLMEVVRRRASMVAAA